MSEGETGGSPLTLPTDSLARSVEPGRRQPLPWLAIVAAALLHALVLILLVIDWSHPPRAPTEPQIVPVKIVFAPPPPPPAAPAPALPPPPKPFGYRESGPGQRTTAPPSAQALAPEPAATPPPAPDQAKPEPQPPAPPPEKPKPAPQALAREQESAKPTPRKQVARLEPQQKEAAKPRAPHLNAPRRLDIEPGERFESGDPYFNQLHALIEQHRVYPRVIGPFGLPVEGAAVYGMLLDRSGKIIVLQLEQSSGVAGIDRAVEDMIRNSAPFPPLPPDYPDRLGVDVTIRLSPPS